MIPLRIFWRAMPSWIKWAAAGALVAALLFNSGLWLGGYQARLAIERDAAEARLENRETSDEIETEVENLDDNGLRSELDRWLRR